MIAIKDMKKPNSCAECKFCIKQKINDYGSYGRCMVKNGEAVNILNCGLSTNCPLIEIVTCKECKYYREKLEKEPHFILLCSKSDDSMLEVAKNVVLAVENTVEAPEGLELLTTNKNQKVKEKLQELIEYLRIYADWR